MPKKQVTFTVAGREVSVSNPEKVYFPDAGYTKLDLAQYYLAVADGALATSAGRPFVMKRYVDGISKEAFYQKRAPTSRPEWIETTTLRFPSGRTAEEVVLRDAAQLLWVVNLGCIELHVHPVRVEDLEHPDELRLDLDPVPGVDWAVVRDVALGCERVLSELGLKGWPKTSGSRGIHVYVRLRPRWTFDEVRRSALAISREVERRMPGLATTKWWKEERVGVFLDYNQNAKDRTTAGAFSVRPTPDARVSMPLDWSEVADVDPALYTIKTVPRLFEKNGNPHRAMDEHAGDLTAALALVATQESEGQKDAPWPPHYEKKADEPPRVQPSRRRKSTMPVIEIARAKRKEDALAGLERWKQRHPDTAARLEQADVLVDAMRGRHSTWTRVRINLKNVPAAERPEQEALDPDYDPGVEWA